MDIWDKYEYVKTKMEIKIKIDQKGLKSSPYSAMDLIIFANRLSPSSISKREAKE